MFTPSSTEFPLLCEATLAFAFQLTCTVSLQLSASKLQIQQHPRARSYIAEQQQQPVVIPLLFFALYLRVLFYLLSTSYSDTGFDVDHQAGRASEQSQCRVPAATKLMTESGEVDNDKH